MNWLIVLLAIVVLVIAGLVIWAINKWQQIRNEIDDDDSGLF